MFALWWLGATTFQYLKLYVLNNHVFTSWPNIVLVCGMPACVYNEAFQPVHVSNLGQVCLNYE